MAGARQPINLVIANGRKHLTKDEIAKRQSSEVQPVADEIAAPSFLTAAQKKEFNRIAAQLQKLNIMGETDCDTLARYITAQSLYTQAVKDLRKLEKDRPKKDKDDDDQDGYYHRLELYYIMIDNAVKRQDRYFKQAQTCARDLGLTISSRCKLVVPTKEAEEKTNRFDKFRTAVNK